MVHPNLFVHITSKGTLKSKGNPPEEEGHSKWTCQRIMNNERFFSLSVLKRVKDMQGRVFHCSINQSLIA